MVGNICIPNSLTGGGSSIERFDYCITSRFTYLRWGSSSSSDRLKSTNVTYYIPRTVGGNSENSDVVPYGFIFQIWSSSVLYVIYGQYMTSPEGCFLMNTTNNTLTSVTGSFSQGITVPMPFGGDRGLTTTFKISSRWDFDGKIFSIVNNTVSNTWTESSACLYLFSTTYGSGLGYDTTIDSGGTHTIYF